VNIFTDPAGAQLVIVTSPGQLTNGTVEVNVSGIAKSSSVPRASVIRPGDTAPEPLATVVRVGVDFLITVTLRRGTAVVRLEL
jgi:hypothetical protein